MELNFCWRSFDMIDNKKEGKEKCSHACPVEVLLTFEKNLCKMERKMQVNRDFFTFIDNCFFSLNN